MMIKNKHKSSASDFNRLVSLFAMLLLVILSFSCQDKKTEEVSNANQNSNMQCTLFLPELFANNKMLIHGYPTFIDESNTVMWPVIPPRILYSKLSEDVWSDPQVAPFTEANIQAAHYHESEKRLYFQMSHSNGYGSLDIGYVQKGASGWSEKHNLGCPPNSESLESQPSLSRNGNLYFTGYFENGGLRRGIYRSVLINDQYQPPELLPEPINTVFIDYMPFISPDEKFLLFASSRPTNDESELRVYVSYQNQNFTWSDPINLNTLIGLDKPTRFPCLTPDGRYIIFLCENRFWKVPAEIIERARNSE